MSINISVYPNPFVSDLSLEVVVEKNEGTIVRLSNHHEKIIKMLNWNLQKGTNKTTLMDLGALPSGNYFMEINTVQGRNLFSTKLVKS